MPGDPRTRDDLLEAMRLRVCPICVLVERAERKAVDLFLYDQVNDISRRDALRASRGLCGQHTTMLSQGRSALGIAIISRDILRTMTAELEEATGAQKHKGAKSLVFWGLGALRNAGARLAERIGPQAPCPMCLERPRIEAPLIAGMLQNLDDAAFAEAFDSSGGLCRTHLASTLTAANSEMANTLATRHATLWRRMEATLDEFIRKHDYRFKDEIVGDERDVWLRALHSVSGWYDDKVKG